jgi:hypothetical protein
LEEALATRGEQEFKENSFVDTCDMLLFDFSGPLSGLSGLWLQGGSETLSLTSGLFLTRLEAVCSGGVPLASRSPEKGCASVDLQSKSVNRVRRITGSLTEDE